MKLLLKEKEVNVKEFTLSSFREEVKKRVLFSKEDVKEGEG